MKKVQKNLSRRKSTKVEVVSKLVGSMTPKSKREVFKKSAVPNYDGAARNLRAEESNKKILDFLEQSDIAYVCPGRKDTVYLGKDVTGERIYKAKHYLRWTFDEIVAMYNEDNPEDKVSYYRIQKLVKENKYLKTIQEKPDDDCHCESCENVELILECLVCVLKRENESEMRRKLPDGPIKLAKTLVCSIYSRSCTSGQCKNCPGFSGCESLFDFICDVPDVKMIF